MSNLNLINIRIEVILRKMKNNEEAMCNFPLCMLVSRFFLYCEILIESSRILVRVYLEIYVLKSLEKIYKNKI